MSMETCDEATGAATAANNSSSSANSECSHPVVKGKRTKRQRAHQSPAPAAAAASSTSSSGDLSGSTTEEDEDMANCLILLAQGRTLDAGHKSEATALQEDGGGDDGGGERFTNRRLAEAATTNGKRGFYVYECKTCNKCFPSFQALGGHRSSHKKPKMAQAAAATTEEKAAMEEDNPKVSANASNPTFLSGNNTTATAALTSRTNINNNSNCSSNNIVIINNNNSGVNNLNKLSRVHECSICGSEFSSGQALGGHMRRHRTAVAMETQEAKKEKSILSLDLNLPAPTDDDRGDYPKSPSFPFAGGQSLLFSPSALVDCHY